MALNVNTITPASLKAKEIATEDYVDSAVSNVSIDDATWQTKVQQALDSNTTTIDSVKITTGSITAGQIAVSTTTADRFTSTTRQSSMWTGGGLVSQNFNGNVVGSIGTPTQGFRLSSNAAGTSSDPNIYGAYIRGGTIAGSVFNGSLASPTIYDIVTSAPGTGWTQIGSFVVPKPSSGEAYRLTILSNLLLSGGNWVIAHFDIKVNGVSITGDYTAPLVPFTGVGEKSKYALSSSTYTGDVTVTIHSYQAPGGYSTAHTTASINVLALATSV